MGSSRRRSRYGHSEGAGIAAARRPGYGLRLDFMQKPQLVHNQACCSTDYSYNDGFGWFISTYHA
ncbi:MAG: hypothetical protein JWR32_1993 [Mycobacterium sp.]|jgi:hypothetical protein|nr:hypothetical protein [Mycobacterium sp.]